MRMVILAKAALAVVVLMAAVVVYLFIPVAEALNTHSIDLESSSGNYLEISDANQVGLDGSTDMTVEAWVKFESLPGSGTNMAIVSKSVSAGDDRSYTFYFSGNGYELRWVNQSDGLAGTDVGVSWTPSTGVWYHVAASKAGTAVKFYVNGTQQGSTQTGTSGIYNSTAPFRIGAHGNTDSYFDGLIDDVRVWNTARTAQEIYDDHDVELNGNESGLVGYWKLNNSLADSSSNGNTLSNSTSAVFSTDTHLPSFTADLAARKSANESVTSSTVLQDDDELSLSLAANKTYIIDGVVFASSTSATPDITLAFTGQTGSIIRIGYTNDLNEMVLDSGESSNRINLPADTPTSIHVKGTVVTSSTSGEFKLKWAQSTSNSNATTVMAGSYLRAVEI